MAGFLGRLVKGIGRVAGGVLTGNPIGGIIGGISAVVGPSASDRRKQSGGPTNVGSPGIIAGQIPGFDPNFGRQSAGQQRRQSTPFAPGGGGRFGGSGAGGSFGPNLPVVPAPRSGGNGASVVRGLDTSMISIASAPELQTVARRVPGKVTVTLPYPAFGFPAGARVQVLKPIASKLGLYRSRPKPLLTAGDVKTLRKADRIEQKLVRTTRKHAQAYTVMTDTQASNLRRNQRPKSQRR